MEYKKRAAAEGKGKAMYDDTNWCFACQCSFDGDGLFCSQRCQDNDEQAIYHPVRWTGSDDAGILAWAADITPSSPPPASPIPSPVFRPSSRSKTPSQHVFRLPKLIQRGRQPAPPALSVTAPSTLVPSPSQPISTLAHLRQHCAASSSASLHSTATSAPTDSSIPTPASTLPLHSLLLSKHLIAAYPPSKTAHELQITLLHPPPHSDSSASPILVAKYTRPRGRPQRPSRAPTFAS